MIEGRKDPTRPHFEAKYSTKVLDRKGARRILRVAGRSRGALVASAFSRSNCGVARGYRL